MKYIVLLLLISCSTTVSTNESNWQSLTSNYLSQDKESFLSYLNKSNPDLYKRIEADATDSELVKLWGNSFNFDSGAKEKIVKDEIVKELHTLFKLENDQHSVHAGVMHTYGYLFSNLMTPYGFKRTRWLNHTLSNAFNLKDNLISPLPKEGTLLSNLTYLAGKIAFKEKQNIEKLNLIKNVAPEIFNYDFSKIKATLIEEAVDPKFNFPFTIRTHLIKFLKKTTSEENDFVLIYSFFNYQTKEEKLITVFPVKKDTYYKSIDSNLFGEDKIIQIKNNADLGQTNENRYIGKRLILRQD